MLPALVTVGLWPFDFQAENHVSILPNGGGARFEVAPARMKSDSGGLLYTPLKPLRLLTAADFRLSATGQGRAEHTNFLIFIRSDKLSRKTHAHPHVL